jgi:hypothetical protein
MAVDRHTECFRHAVGGNVAVRRPDPAGEEIGAAMPQRIECVDDRCRLVANHPHFLEIEERRQMFRDIADVLVLVRPDRVLLLIATSAAVTLEADEVDGGMITCG